MAEAGPQRMSPTTGTASRPSARHNAGDPDSQIPDSRRSPYHYVGIWESGYLTWSEGMPLGIWVGLRSRFDDPAPSRLAGPQPELLARPVQGGGGDPGVGGIGEQLRGGYLTRMLTTPLGEPLDRVTEGR